jgi:hypothetical protein
MRLQLTTHQGDYLMDEGLITTSGKMLLLDRVLPRLRAEKRKASPFFRSLQITRERAKLTYNRCSYSRK